MSNATQPTGLAVTEEAAERGFGDDEMAAADSVGRAAR